MSRALLIIEREDVEKAHALHAEAKVVLDKWLASVRAALPILFPEGEADSQSRGRLFAAAKRATAEKRLFELEHGDARYVFHDKTGAIRGEFIPKERNPYGARGRDVIDVYSHAFGALRKLRSISGIYNSPRTSAEEKIGIRKQAGQLLLQLETTTDDRQIIQILAHEMTHLHDHLRHPITRELDYRESKLSQLARRGGLNPEAKKQDYMGARSEQNAHFMHALTTLVSTLKSPNPPTWNQFLKLVKHQIGDRWKYIPEPQQRQLTSRAYQAYQQHVQRKQAAGVVEALLR